MFFCCEGVSSSSKSGRNPIFFYIMMNFYFSCSNEGLRVWSFHFLRKRFTLPHPVYVKILTRLNTRWVSLRFDFELLYRQFFEIYYFF
jgi:hypothetical protein